MTQRDGPTSPLRSCDQDLPRRLPPGGVFSVSVGIFGLGRSQLKNGGPGAPSTSLASELGHFAFVDMMIAENAPPQPPIIFRGPGPAARRGLRHSVGTHVARLVFRGALRNCTSGEQFQGSSPALDLILLALSGRGRPHRGGLLVFHPRCCRKTIAATHASGYLASTPCQYIQLAPDAPRVRSNFFGRQAVEPAKRGGQARGFGG
jgi:hypothetical protein